ncbi:unnamed protein product, partial [Nesidiocoris tenuis]
MPSKPVKCKNSARKSPNKTDEIKLKFAEQEVIGILKNFDDPRSNELYKTVLLLEDKRFEQLSANFLAVGTILAKIRKCNEDLKIKFTTQTQIKCFQKRLASVEAEIKKIKETVARETERLRSERTELEESLADLDDLLRNASLGREKTSGK